MKRRTKEAMVKEHLQRGQSITPYDALNLYGSFRLSAIIFNLRNRGMDITTEYITAKGSTFANYKLRGRK
jgi:hypothetical protein